MMHEALSATVLGVERSHRSPGVCPTSPAHALVAASARSVLAIRAGCSIARHTQVGKKR